MTMSHATNWNSEVCICDIAHIDMMYDYTSVCNSAGMKGEYSYLDYGNTQLTNQIASLAVTIFVSDLFRGIYS